MRGHEQARENLRRECRDEPRAFDTVRHTTRPAGATTSTGPVEGGTPARRTVLATSL